MASYRVLIPWVSEQGSHKPGDLVEIKADTSPTRVEVNILVNYGIVELASRTPKEPSTPSGRSRG